MEIIYNFYKKPLIENFLFGQSPTEKNDKSIVKSSNISREMVVNAVKNISSKVGSEIAQNNKAEIGASMTSSNVMTLEDSTIKGNMDVSGNLQGIVTTADVKSNVKQENKVDISNELSTNIVKEITNIIPDNVNNSNIKKLTKKGLNNVMKEVDKVRENEPNFLQGVSRENAAKDLVNSFMGKIGGKPEKTTTNKTNIKDTFQLDDSMTNNEENNIENEIKSVVNQENISTCKASVLNSNLLLLRNLNVGGNANITNNEQYIESELIMSCIIDQVVSTEISNKIVNNIESNITKDTGEIEENNPELVDLYKAVADTATVALVEKGTEGEIAEEEIASEEEVPINENIIVETSNNNEETIDNDDTDDDTVNVETNDTDNVDNVDTVDPVDTDNTPNINRPTTRQTKPRKWNTQYNFDDDEDEPQNTQPSTEPDTPEPTKPKSEKNPEETKNNQMMLIMIGGGLIFLLLILFLIIRM